MMDDAGLRDFDFLMGGTWRVSHRRLKARLAGNNEWEEFDGTLAAHKILGGQGNIDDNVLNIPSGSYRAFAVRSFDPKTRTWAIWWLDARNPHTLEPPVMGAFDNGVGTFYGDDTFNGRPIKVRFKWTRTNTPSPGWEQAFSPDGGATWETNWVMSFVREGAK